MKIILFYYSLIQMQQNIDNFGEEEQPTAFFSDEDNNGYLKN